MAGRLLVSMTGSQVDCVVPTRWEEVGWEEGKKQGEQITKQKRNGKAAAARRLAPTGAAHRWTRHFTAMPTLFSLSLSLSLSLSFFLFLLLFLFLSHYHLREASKREEIHQNPVKPSETRFQRKYKNPPIPNKSSWISFAFFFFFHLRRTSETLYVSINTQSNRIETQ